MNPTREDAWRLLNQYNSTPSLIKHALAVEAAMRAYARRYAEDEELWAVTCLIHDVDYEQHPTAAEHPMFGVTMLQEMGWPAEITEAIKGHGTYLNVHRVTKMAQALFAVDELTGFVAACALVRPDKSIMNLTVKSVKNKWKDKAFARGVDRTVIEKGAELLGEPLDVLIQEVIYALRPIEKELGLG